MQADCVTWGRANQGAALRAPSNLVPANVKLSRDDQVEPDRRYQQVQKGEKTAEMPVRRVPG